MRLDSDVASATEMVDERERFPAAHWANDWRSVAAAKTNTVLA